MTNNKKDKMLTTDTSFVRTNVIADYIEKLTNDINMVGDELDEDYDYSVKKHTALMISLLIIVLLVFMFLDQDKDTP